MKCALDRQGAGRRRNQEFAVIEYRVAAHRIDSHGSLATAKDAEVVLDTDLTGRRDAMNPVELLLSALAACMLKGIERVTPMLRFELQGAEVALEAIRQDAPPKLTLIRYQITVDSPETDQRLDLLHRNILKYGTISNTLAGAVPLEGTLRRRA
jgi:uncharacterized OsmC-like protein